MWVTAGLVWHVVMVESFGNVEPDGCGCLNAQAALAGPSLPGGDSNHLIKKKLSCLQILALGRILSCIAWLILIENIKNHAESQLAIGCGV